MTTIEVFADVACPFAHVGLRRLTDQRDARGRHDVTFHVRAWPLELVNGKPLDAAFIDEEIDEIRPQVAPDLFAGFDAEQFPTTSLPALALEAAAYAVDPEIGERVSLELRDRLFERGENIADAAVLAAVADSHGVSWDPTDLESPRRDHAEGQDRDVIGSPHFFTETGSYFCPVLDVRRDDAGRLIVSVDVAGIESFLEACFA